MLEREIRKIGEQIKRGDYDEKELDSLIKDLRTYEKAEAVYAFGQFAHFTGINDEVEVNELDHYLHKLGHQKVLVEEIYAGIEDVFMNLMEKPAVGNQH